MTKQYFKWEPGFDPAYVLRRIDEIRTIRNGAASFSAFEYEYWMPILNSAVGAKGQGRNFKHEVIRKVIADPKINLRGEPARFLASCEQRLLKLTSEKLKEYVLFCSVTHSGPRLFRELRDGSTKIVWAPPKRQKFLKVACTARASENIAFAKSNAGLSDNERNLTTVLVYVEALSPHNALEIGREALDSLRGIINLLINTQRGINPFSLISNTPPHAINRIRLAPYQTVHNPDGSLAAEMIWYEAHWSHSIAPVKFSEPVNRHGRVIQKWWRNSRSSVLKEHLVEGFVRYCRALDVHDGEIALLQLWSALEALLGTSKYDQLVSRVVKLFRSEAEARQLAEHIRTRRNASVHGAIQPGYAEAETIVIQACSLVARVLTFLTNENVPFRSPKEVYEFLDLPLSFSDLKRQQTLIGEFLDYRSDTGRWKAKSPQRKAQPERGGGFELVLDSNAKRND